MLYGIHRHLSEQYFAQILRTFVFAFGFVEVLEHVSVYAHHAIAHHGAVYGCDVAIADYPLGIVFDDVRIHSQEFLYRPITAA